MPPKKPQEGTFWEKAAYRAANDNTTVAIYRVLMGLMGSMLLTLLYHYGSGLTSSQEEMARIIATHDIKIELLTSGQVAANERLKMIEDRDVRMLDRLNVNTNDITALKTLNLAMPRR